MTLDLNLIQLSGCPALKKYSLHDGYTSHTKPFERGCQIVQRSTEQEVSEHSPLSKAPLLTCHSLYLTNLPSKMQKQDLRLSLYALFATYGTILDVVAMKTAKMRGQAHVVFRDVETSTQAMRALQGFDFFGNEMVSAPRRRVGRDVVAHAVQKIAYARGRSQVFNRLEGKYEPPSAAATSMATEVQQSVFNAPVPGSVAATMAAGPAPGVTTNGTKADGAAGVKRAREEASDEGSLMDEDDDVDMEASSEED